MDKKMSPRDTVLVMLALGALAGFVEVAGSHFIRMTDFPFRAGLLTGIGFLFVAIGIVLTKRPVAGLGIGLFTVLAKQLVVPVLGMSVMCKMNSSIAVMLEFGALSAVAAMAMPGMKKSLSKRALVGGGAAIVAAVAFFGIGMRVAPCAYLLSFNSAVGFLRFMGIEGGTWAAFSALLFPVGWSIGLALENSIETAVSRNAMSFRMATFLASAAVLGLTGAFIKFVG